jgi:hypothetical protein
MWGKTHIEALLEPLRSTQPGCLAEYIRGALTGGADDDGMVQRFSLLVWPDQRPQWNRDAYPASEPHGTQSWFRNSTEFLLAVDVMRVKQLLVLLNRVFVGEVQLKCLAIVPVPAEGLEGRPFACRLDPLVARQITVLDNSIKIAVGILKVIRDHGIEVGDSLPIGARPCMSRVCQERAASAIVLNLDQPGGRSHSDHDGGPTTW